MEPEGGPMGTSTMGAAKIVTLGHDRPDVAEDAFVAPGATLVGRVRLGSGSSVWFGAVLRGDTERIAIGRRSNLQDGCVGHADPGFPLEVGDRVTVGHGAVVHGCRIGDDVLVGMGAVLMNGVVVGRGSLIAAGAVVTQHTEIPPGSLVAGVPAAVVREVGDAETTSIARAARHYVDLAARYRALQHD